MKIHHSITMERLEAACEARTFGLENGGFCIACGADAEGCEPDAGPLRCDQCGETKVFGAEEIALRVF